MIADRPGLTPFDARCERLVFISMNDDVEPLTSSWGHPDHLGVYPFDGSGACRYRISLESDWKVALDAFLEIYHGITCIHKSCHSQIL